MDRTKNVVVEYRWLDIMSVPEDWDEQMVNFHLNESTWCSENAAQSIIDSAPEGQCNSCIRFAGRFVRDANPGEVVTDLGKPE